jgi:hypothetical protein
MITLDNLSESARYMDALSEEHGFEGWARLADVDPEALSYVAGQRALRAAMIMDGQDPSKLSRTEKTTVNLSPHIREMLPTLTALSMDGLGIGLDAGRKAERQDS